MRGIGYVSNAYQVAHTHNTFNEGHLKNVITYIDNNFCR